MLSTGQSKELGQRVMRVALNMGNIPLTAFKVHGLVGFQIIKCEVASYLTRIEYINAGDIVMKVQSQGILDW